MINNLLFITESEEKLTPQIAAAIGNVDLHLAPATIKEDPLKSVLDSTKQIDLSKIVPSWLRSAPVSENINKNIPAETENSPVLVKSILDPIKEKETVETNPTNT